MIAAHEMLGEYMGRPWSDFEQAMARMRYVVEYYDAGWEDVARV